MDCFAVKCVSDRVGSSVKAVRSVLNRLRNTPKLVTVYAKFTNVPPDIANLDLLKGCQQLYNHETRCLIVTVTGLPHEVAATTFFSELQFAVSDANLRQSWALSGRSRVQGNSSYKEPDGSTFRSICPPNRSDISWPSVVLEVGVSESKKKLRADAAWWLSNSNGLVNLVVTISIHQKIPQITLESIVLQKPISTLRNGRPRYELETRQSIAISRPLGGPDQAITCVPDTPLIVSCEDLFCRAPIPPETDPNISVDALKKIASLVWYCQDI